MKTRIPSLTLTA